MSYNVFLVEKTSLPRNHHAIFVETGNDISGYIFHVTGNVQNGMTFEIKRLNEPPENSATFNNKTLIGAVSVANFGSLETVLRSIPPPSKQFHGAKRIDPSKPLRRCQEWTKEAIDKLKKTGLLKESIVEMFS